LSKSEHSLFAIPLGIFGGGFIYSLAAATVGAVVLVAIVHLLVGSDR
jgi:uncharacterized membrane protein YeaQ/YmgE (transglycosylase-associated protein family)